MAAVRTTGGPATTSTTVIPGSAGIPAGMTRESERPYVSPPPFLVGAPRLPTREDYIDFL